MAEKKITNAQIIEATRNAEAYFQDTKNRGKILVNAGKLSKEDYYKKIREVAMRQLNSYSRGRETISIQQARNAIRTRLSKGVV